MDIDDIIRDFETSSQPPKRSNVYEDMVRVMLNERMAPEVLPFEHNLIETLLETLAQQQQYLLDFHEYGQTNAQTGVIEDDFKLHLMIVETDIERMHYLIRIYLRTRLAKLDKFTVFYVNKAKEDDKVLSPQETAYISRHLKLLTKLYNSSFFAKLPTNLSSLDDESGGISMIDEPDVDQPVFLQYLGEPIVVDLGEDEVDFVKGGLYIARYSKVREYLKIGDVRLL